MSVPPEICRWLLAAGWIGTLFAAYSVARLTQDAPARRMHAVGSAKAVHRTLPDGRADASTINAAAAPASSEAELSVISITGGMPLEQWLGRLVKEPDEILRVSTFLRLLETLETPEEIKQALEIVLASSERGNNRLELSMLLQKWTQQDPKGALAFAQARQGGDRGLAMSAVLRTWTRANPEDALAWAQANPESTDRRGRREGGRSLWQSRSPKWPAIIWIERFR